MIYNKLWTTQDVHRRITHYNGWYLFGVIPLWVQIVYPTRTNY